MDRPTTNCPRYPKLSSWIIDLDINELAPFFPVAGKPPHERSIAVPAKVATSHVSINGVVLDPGFGTDGFCENFSYNYSFLGIQFSDGHLQPLGRLWLVQRLRPFDVERTAVWISLLACSGKRCCCSAPTACNEIPVRLTPTPMSPNFQLD